MIFKDEQALELETDGVKERTELMLGNPSVSHPMTEFAEHPFIRCS